MEALFRILRIDPRFRLGGQPGASGQESATKGSKPFPQTLSLDFHPWLAHPDLGRQF